MATTTTTRIDQETPCQPTRRLGFELGVGTHVTDPSSRIVSYRFLLALYS
jgi:hypothetical protein